MTATNLIEKGQGASWTFTDKRKLTMVLKVNFMSDLLARLKVATSSYVGVVVGRIVKTRSQGITERNKTLQTISKGSLIFNWSYSYF